jgi:predicted phosphodiesterase
MTKIQIFSDLHLGHYKDFEREKILDSLYCNEADISICAGDIGVSFELKKYLNELCVVCKNLIYVNGNHDHWDSSFSKLHAIMEDIQAKHSNFYWLENKRVKVEGHNFIGATLWYPLNKKNIDLFKSFSDSWCVEHGYPNIDRAHKESVKYLKKNIQENDIVVTHHGLSKKSVPKQFINDFYNCFFYTDQEELIRKTKPKLIIQGHTHGNLDYMINNTRVIANPLAYPMENPAFNPQLLLDI